MDAAARSTFGPYYLQNVIALSEGAELSLASSFVPDGTRQLVALRRITTLPRTGKGAPPDAGTSAEDSDGGVNQRFLEKAARYAVLHHPSIVEVKDLGTLEGRAYVATEYVRGKSLLSALASCGRIGLGFPTDVALYIACSVLEALDHAHALKRKNGDPLEILHRDLRHSNVLLTFDGAVKVSDFEIGMGSTHIRTPRGVCIGGRHGYFSYLAPEQARLEEVTSHSDIFSLGVVLYELVTGRHLFSDRSEELLLQRLQQGVYDLPIARYRPDLNPELESIIRTALAPDKRDRFSSASALHRALSTFLDSVHVSAGRESLRDLMERLFGADEEAE